MDNIVLFEKFKEIGKISNCFDRELALKAFNKEYKKSQFYKQTHYSVHKAYYLVISNVFNSISMFMQSDLMLALTHGDYGKILSIAESTFEEFDYTCLDNFFEYLTKGFETLLNDNNINQDTLQQLADRFKESIGK